LRKDRCRIYFATTNKDKFLEAESILKEYGIQLIFLGRRGIEIQSDSIEEIVRQSAINLSPSTKIPAISEDAGLFIDALKGFPGPYSSFVFRTLGCGGILRLLEGKSNRDARFVSYVAYCESNSEPVCFSGVSQGTIAMEARGTGGFGFDPIFIPSGADTRTFAEMSRAEKGEHSHRAKAFRNLAEWLSASKT